MKCSYPTCENVCDKFKNGEYKLHCSKSCCARHNALKSVEKKKQTCIERYGVPYPIGTDFVKKKIKNTISEKYGVENISQSESIKNKKKETLISNYGVDHPLKSNIIKDRVRSTIESRYGVSHVSYIGKSLDTIDLLSNVGKIVELNKQFCLYSISRQYGLSDRTLREILEKNNITPIYHADSSFEKEVKSYIEDNYTGSIIIGSRILDNKELDIFLPELSLGFECNGAYWHSEIAGHRDKTYHINKLNSAINRNIKMIQIWDYEWYSKMDIIKSMISHLLNRSERIYARKCKVIVLSKEDEVKFFNKNHIQGFVYSYICYGLEYNNQIVAAMSFVKSRYDKSIDFELLRFANKINTTIVGGASKLLSEFVKNNKDKSIISYSHKHISDGKLYRNLGFSYLRTTGSSCYYTNNYKTFSNRITYQKHKLEKILSVFDKNLTEWQNMQNNGFDRIWDCGNDVWIYKGK